jgi:formate hydrogenlyase transcriptional activator
MEALQQHHWPGNIRELQNFIERSLIMASGSVLRPRLEELTPPQAQPLVRTLADAERAHILATLRETNGVVGGSGGAAARLGLPRTTLIAKMQELGLSRESPQRAEDHEGHPSSFHSHRVWGRMRFVAARASI